MVASQTNHQVERINGRCLLDRRGILIEDLYGNSSRAADPNRFQGFWDAGVA
jgi:hypothetical protein